MTAPAQSLPDTRGQSRWFGWMFTLAVIIVAPIVLVIAAAVAVYLWWQLAEAKAAGEVQAEVARIQSQGQPVTIYDLYQYHRVPAGTKDITGDWLAVLRMYGGQMNTDGAALPIVGTGKMESLAADAPDSSLAAAEAYLLKYDRGSFRPRLPPAGWKANAGCRRRLRMAQPVCCRKCRRSARWPGT